MRKRTNFIKLIKLWGIIFLIGIGVSIIAIDVISSYRDLNSRTDQMRADYIALQEQIIKQEVNRVVDLISYEKKQSEILLRSRSNQGFTRPILSLKISINRIKPQKARLKFSK